MEKVHKNREKIEEDVTRKLVEKGLIPILLN